MTDNTKALNIYVQNPIYYSDAEAIAARLGGMALIGDGEENQDFLSLDDDGLSLKGDGLSLKGDFSRLIGRIDHNKLNGELIIKAAKYKKTEDPQHVIDATAGLGEDSFLLAAVGFNVSLYEYNPVIYELLRDAHGRALMEPRLREIAERMEIFNGDSIVALGNIPFTPTIVLLDPMFPKRQKSGLVKKKFQLLQSLEHPCSNECQLIESAKAAHPKKIIIKRPINGPFLGGVKPNYSIKGKGIRYDCITL